MSVDSEAGNVEKSGEIAALLLAHYDRHARDLPWRTGPAAMKRGERPDPYRVWLSEIMLQQTTVAAVVPYFERFTARWPDVGKLATADPADILAAWAGLGYYARARNLIACAQQVAGERAGRFPDSEAELRGLPGIGTYSAAAIAAIAFDRRAVVVDANVERVIARLFAIEDPLPAGKPCIRACAERLTPDLRAGDFAQAMMDLGATICTPKTPDCGGCPVAVHCRARARAIADMLPRKLPKAAKPQRRGIAWWIERDGRVLLVTRPPRGMLGGLRALPDDGWNARRDGTGEPPLPGDWLLLSGSVRHVFTHFALDLEMAVYRGGDFDMVPQGEWWPLDRLGEAGLPTLFGKAAKLASLHEK
ncbi:MAG: A/G-specific adenine glycosylase [Blastomonas sp.]